MTKRNSQLPPIFQDIVNSFAPAIEEKPVFPMQYRGYTIIETERLWKTSFMYYKTEQGIDCEFDGERTRSNISFADTLEDAKDEIMEKIAMSMPDHEVQVQSGKVEKFSYFSQAVRAAIQSNGILLTPINSI
jgi:hypothetical protein